MSKWSKWTPLWIAWLAAFVAIELAAALSHDPKPRPLSEHLWAWFPKHWGRVLIVGLLALLCLHIGAGPDVAPHVAPWTESGIQP
jgi:hypothetical protein